MQQYPQSPKTRVKKILQNGCVRCNGKIVTLHSYELKKGDVVEIVQSNEAITKKSLPFKILYDDQYLIAIDKPAGISTSSSDGSSSIHRILGEVLKSQSKGKIKAFVIHRLDKEVSGVLLFAKSERIMNLVKDRWKESKKLYYALVEGTPEKSEGTITSFLVEDGSQKMYSVENSQKGKYSVTHYRTLKKLHKYTLLEINIETGRKNQIRVHLSEMGCSIVGDRRYGASDEVVRRIRLHAWFLSFPHPVTGAVITIKSPMPEGFMTPSDTDEKYK